MNRKKIIFVTGTDTGVGKTLFTGLLLQHLRSAGKHALAMKPFCSGGRGDINLLQSLQRGELTDAEMNPYYFSEPVAPLIGAKKNARPIRLPDVVRKINAIKNKCETLVVEGSGGLLVPLGKGFTVADLIGELDCKVMVVCRNQLGTINHTLLTIQALKKIGISLQNMTIVMTGTGKTDPSCRTNYAFMKQLTAPISVFELPFFGKKASSKSKIEENSVKAAAILADIIHARDGFRSNL